MLIITEKQTYVEFIINLNEPESDAFINESFSDLTGDASREQLITHLLSTSTEKQKEAVKKQYLLNSKNIMFFHTTRMRFARTIPIDFKRIFKDIICIK